MRGKKTNKIDKQLFTIHGVGFIAAETEPDRRPVIGFRVQLFIYLIRWHIQWEPFILSQLNEVKRALIVWNA